MQTFVVIGEAHFKPEHCKFLWNLEFYQNTVSGTCACSSLIHNSRSQWKITTREHVSFALNHLCPEAFSVFWFFTQICIALKSPSAVLFCVIHLSTVHLHSAVTGSLAGCGKNLCCYPVTSEVLLLDKKLTIIGSGRPLNEMGAMYAV